MLDDSAVLAVTIEGFGGLDEVKVQDVPAPEPGPGEVTVRVHAAALNHLDIWTFSGALGIELEFPFVLGADGAGEIDATGPRVEGLRPGMRVLINPGLSCGSCERCRAGEQSQCLSFGILGEHAPGTFAELVKVPARNVFPFPDHLSFEEAAALGVTFITAYRMLFTQGELRPGEWVMITGIGGGLALSLLELARPVAGRLFVTSSSDEKLERALALGVDHAINYKTSDVAREVRRLTSKRGVDLVADSAGGSSLDASLRSLRPGGRVVIAGATAGRAAEVDLRRLFWNHLRVIGSTMGNDSDVSEMLRLVAGAQIRPPIDRTFPLDEASDALAYLQEQKQFGKVVLQIR